MENVSNQKLKEVKDILKNGNTSITKNSNLTYEKLNIVTGSSEYRTLFLRSLIPAIDSEHRNEISILTNIDNLQTTRVKTTRIMEKDMDKVVMNICDDIFAVSRFRIQWVDRPNLIYVIDIPNYDCKEKYVDKLCKVISVASQLNIMIILGMLDCSRRYKDFCNVLSIVNNQIGNSFINGDEFKVIDNKLFVDNAEEDITSFELYGYNKVVDDENRVIYQKDNYSIEINKKLCRYGKFYNDEKHTGAYILEHEDRLIHELLNIFKRFRMLDELKDTDKKKIRLTQKTIDKTDKTLKNLSSCNGELVEGIFAVYYQNNKADKKTYVTELLQDKTILFGDKPTGFDSKTCLYLTNELINHYTIVGKEEMK